MYTGNPKRDFSFLACALQENINHQFTLNPTAPRRFNFLIMNDPQILNSEHPKYRVDPDQDRGEMITRVFAGQPERGENDYLADRGYCFWSRDRWRSWPWRTLLRDTPTDPWTATPEDTAQRQSLENLRRRVAGCNGLRAEVYKLGGRGRLQDINLTELRRLHKESVDKKIQEPTEPRRLKILNRLSDR